MVLGLGSIFSRGIEVAVGRLLADDGIGNALAEGGDGMQLGIMRRCIDYDKNFSLKRLGFKSDQRAIASIYIFSKEVTSFEYFMLECAIRNYAERLDAVDVFSKVDSHLNWIDGRLVWCP